MLSFDAPERLIIFKNKLYLNYVEELTHFSETQNLIANNFSLILRDADFGDSGRCTHNVDAGGKVLWSRLDAG